MKLSDLRSAADIHEQNMRDPEYKREYERTKLANDVAVRVLTYRTEHGMSQTDLARMLGMRQPNIARLESGEHEPALSTLARLSSVLGMDFSVDITPAGACLAELRAPTAARRKRSAILVGANSAPAENPQMTLVTARRAAGKHRVSTSQDRDQKTARLRDLERLRDLVHPYTTSKGAPIGDAIGRMPAAEQTEALHLLSRLSDISEDPEKTAARQQILLDLARAEDVLRDILGRPHFKIRNGQVVTDPATGEPVPDHKPEQEARRLLADMDRLRSQITGLPLGRDPAAAAK